MQEYECGGCGGIFTYGETRKVYDDCYGELYLICECCGGECLPKMDDAQWKTDNEQECKEGGTND